VVSHIPNKGQVLQRYYGWYANRTRGRRRRAGMPEPAPMVEPISVGAAAAAPLALRDTRRRWAELLRRIFEVGPLRCPRCGEGMRILGFVTEPGVIARILDHVRRPATAPSRQPRAPPRRRRTSRPTTPA
jgi:hypothetical protein